MGSTASHYDDKQGAGKPFEYFSKAEAEDLAAGTTIVGQVLEEESASPSLVPTFNTTAEQSNKTVPTMELHNRSRPTPSESLSVGIEELVTTEQADFSPSGDTQRNWRDLIRDNPFEANQSAHE